MPRYVLHIANKNYSSWSLRAWLVMRQVLSRGDDGGGDGVPFTEKLWPMASGSMAQPRWRAFSPVAHVPCLHVFLAGEPDAAAAAPGVTATAAATAAAGSGSGSGAGAGSGNGERSSSQWEPGRGEEGEGSGAGEDGRPLVLWESLAIVEFLAEEHPAARVYPADRAARAWARSAVAEMHAGFAAVRREMGMNVGVRIALAEEAFTDALVADLRRLDELWSEGLSRFGGPFLAGAEFTAVDAFYAPVVLRLQTYVGTLDRMGEAARGYVERMLQVEGVREWVDAALKETWREPVHEAECLEGKGRTLIADLRAA